MLGSVGPKILAPASRSRSIAYDGDLLLVCPHGVHPQRLQVVDGGAERHLLGDVHGAGLELVGDRVPRRVVVVDLADHLAPAEERIHLLEELALGVQPAGGRRAEHLVPAEREEVAVQLGDVDGAVGNELRPVDEDHGADGVRGLDEVAQRRQRPEGVRHPGDGEDLRALRQQRFQARQVQQALVGQRDVPQGRPRVARAELPGDDVGMMLHLGEEDLVPLAQVSATPCVGDEVDRFGGPAVEDDRFRRGGARGILRFATWRPRRAPSPPPRACRRPDGRWRCAVRRTPARRR